MGEHDDIPEGIESAQELLARLGPTARSLILAQAGILGPDHPEWAQTDEREIAIAQAELDAHLDLRDELLRALEPYRLYTPIPPEDLDAEAVATDLATLRELLEPLLETTPRDLSLDDEQVARLVSFAVRQGPDTHTMRVTLDFAGRKLGLATTDHPVDLAEHASSHTLFEMRQAFLDRGPGATPPGTTVLQFPVDRYYLPDAARSERLGEALLWVGGNPMPVMVLPTRPRFLAKRGLKQILPCVALLEPTEESMGQLGIAHGFEAYSFKPHLSLAEVCATRELPLELIVAVAWRLVALFSALHYTGSYAGEVDRYRVLFMGDGEAVLCSPRPAGWFGEVVERLPVSVVPLR